MCFVHIQEIFGFLLNSLTRWRLKICCYSCFNLIDLHQSIRDYYSWKKNHTFTHDGRLCFSVTVYCDKIVYYLNKFDNKWQLEFRLTIWMGYSNIEKLIVPLIFTTIKNLFNFTLNRIEMVVKSASFSWWKIKIIGEQEIGSF